MTIDRQIYPHLSRWLGKVNRKPLILRGARQVGKTYSVRYFAQEKGLDLIEINLEKYTELIKVFESLSLKKILLEIEAISQKKITNNTLIFFDEVQMAPAVLASLRYFFEERPDLKVIATGSLLDFAFENNKKFSMPVGRVEYAYMWPLTFLEFLGSLENEKFYFEMIRDEQKVDSIIAHERLLDLLRIYFFVGGMPEAVKCYMETQDLKQVINIQEQLLTSIQDDFGKYVGARDLALMQRIFKSLPKTVAKKVKYSAIDPDEKAQTIKGYIDLFKKARLIHPIFHTAANDIPISAYLNHKIFKLIFFDIGLFLRMHKTPPVISKIELDGILAEQFVGQELVAMGQDIEESVCYWLREQKAQNAEVDYIIQRGADIIPIEVKSHSKGALRSLHQLMANGLKQAIRIDENIAREDLIKTVIQDGRSVEYRLLSIPMYLIHLLNTIEFNNKFILD